MSAAALRAWLQANPRAPRAWRALAERAAESGDPAMWPAGADPLPLFTVARDALKQALSETSRQTDEEESSALDAVDRQIEALRAAIERAPLPRGTATLHGLKGGGLPDAAVFIGWRDVPDDLLPGAYATSIDDMLTVAGDMLKAHRSALPIRAVERHRDRPKSLAFVRWMDYIARVEARDIAPATLAAWCNAALGDTLTTRDVQRILRKTPAALKAPTQPR